MSKGFNSVFDQYRGLSRSIYIIFFARMVTSMGSFIWPMLMFIMSDKMGFDAITIGIISAGTIILYMPFNIVGGKLADRFDKKKIIIVFDLISVAFFLSCSMLEPGIPMLVMFTLAGLFATMEWPAFDALFMEASKPDEREQVYSLNYLGMNLGLAFGAMIGGFLFNNYLSLAFLLDGLTTISSTLMIVLFVKTVKITDMEDHEKNEYEDEEEDHVGTRDVLKERKPMVVMLAVLTLSSFVYQQWSFSLPLYLNHLYTAAVGAPMYGLIMSFNAFIVIAFTPVITAVMSKINELPKVMIGVGLFSLSFLMIMGNPVKYVFFLMIFVFTIGEIVNTIGNNPYMSRRIPASHRGRVSSYMGMAYMIGNLLSHVVGGFAIQLIGYDVTFVILAVVGVLCVMVVRYNYGLDRKRFPKLYDKKRVATVEE